MPDIFTTAQRTGNGFPSPTDLDPMNLNRDVAVLRLDMMRQVAALAAARERAEATSRAKAAFIAMIGHEVRTPLNAIVGYSDLSLALCDGFPTVPPRLADYTRRIHEAASHLTKLINRVLDLGKIESGRMEIAPTSLDLGNTLELVFGMVREQASTAGIDLETILQPGITTVWGDEEMVIEMLLNLLSNALRFTPRGGKITIRANAAKDGGVSLGVADTGCGIPANKLALVFSPYEQADNHYRRAMTGTGLGLSLVRAMIELHRGRVTITSTPNIGTVITLHFPPAPTARDSGRLPS